MPRSKIVKRTYSIGKATVEVRTETVPAHTERKIKVTLQEEEKNRWAYNHDFVLWRFDDFPFLEVEVPISYSGYKDPYELRRDTEQRARDWVSAALEKAIESELVDGSLVSEERLTDLEKEYGSEGS